MAVVMISGKQIPIMILWTANRFSIQPAKVQFVTIASHSRAGAQLYRRIIDGWLRRTAASAFPIRNGFTAVVASPAQSCRRAIEKVEGLIDESSRCEMAGEKAVPDGKDSLLLYVTCVAKRICCKEINAEFKDAIEGKWSGCHLGIRTGIHP